MPIVQRQLDSGSDTSSVVVNGTEHATEYTFAIESIEPVGDGNYQINLSCSSEDVAGTGVGDFDVNVVVEVDGTVQADYLTGECRFRQFEGQVTVPAAAGSHVRVEVTWDAFGSDGVGLDADIPFDPETATVLEACEPDDAMIVLDGSEPLTIPGWNTWANETGTHIVFDAEVTIGNQPAPITVTNTGDHLVQTGTGAYRVKVGPLTTHTVEFDISVPDLPATGGDYSVWRSAPEAADGFPI